MRIFYDYNKQNKHPIKEESNHEEIKKIRSKEEIKEKLYTEEIKFINEDDEINHNAINEEREESRIQIRAAQITSFRGNRGNLGMDRVLNIGKSQVW